MNKVYNFIINTFEQSIQAFNSGENGTKRFCLYNNIFVRNFNTTDMLQLFEILKFFL